MRKLRQKDAESPAREPGAQTRIPLPAPRARLLHPGPTTNRSPRGSMIGRDQSEPGVRQERTPASPPPQARTQSILSLGSLGERHPLFVIG